MLDEEILKICITNHNIIFVVGSGYSCKTCSGMYGPYWCSKCDNGLEYLRVRDMKDECEGCMNVGG